MLNDITKSKLIHVDEVGKMPTNAYMSPSEEIVITQEIWQINAVDEMVLSKSFMIRLYKELDKLGYFNE